MGEIVEKVVHGVKQWRELAALIGIRRSAQQIMDATFKIN